MGDVAVEEDQPVGYSKQHYPNGLNSNFLKDDVDELRTSYSGKGGLFEDAELRDIAGNVPQILDALGNLEGLTVADCGAGTGLFTVEFDKLVGEHGHVYAIEISEGFLRMLQEKIDTVPLKRTSTIECTARDPNLPGPVDMIFVCDVYHHFEYPIQFCTKLYEALNPGGTLVVIDFHRIPEKIWSHPKDWVLEHVRAGQEVFTAEITTCGFVLDREIFIDSLEENYFLMFRKR